MTPAATWIAWSPHWGHTGYFGRTPEEAIARACYPTEPDNAVLGWASLARNGWRVDRLTPAPADAPR